MAEPLVAVNGLSTGYGSKTVLSGIDLEVFPGEVVALLGPNGSGKTTLLKAACGAIDAWQGSVSIDGRNVGSMSVKERALKVAYVPQTEDHPFDFTVHEITLMGRLAHSDGLFETARDHEAASRAMADADCQIFADRMISTLSGGEAQRALIARALAQESPLLLCDEPTTHLDPKHQVEIANLLVRQKYEGKGILVSSHDLNWAMGCCDRAVLLHDGQALFIGTLEEAVRDGWHEKVYGLRFASAQAGDRTFVFPTGC